MKASFFQILKSKLTSGRKKRMRAHMSQRLKTKLDHMGDVPLPESIAESLQLVEKALKTSNDMVVREFYLGKDAPKRAAVIFIDGLSDTQLTDDFILKAGMFETTLHENMPLAEDELRRLGIPINDLKVGKTLKDVVDTVLTGDAAVLIDGVPRVLQLNAKGWVQRGIEEASTESVVRGPRDSFTETIRTNTAMIRRRLKDPNLCVESMKVGRRSLTDIAIMYLEDIADPKLVEEVKRRINGIDIDAVLESGYIEQFIEDHHISPFPIIQNTERPDKAVANILEGRIIIVCDGTPFVLIAPSVFAQFYQSPEDYYERFLIGTLIRFIRIISMGMALLLPSLYCLQLLSSGDDPVAACYCYGSWSVHGAVSFNYRGIPNGSHDGDSTGGKCAAPGTHRSYDRHRWRTCRRAGCCSSRHCQPNHGYHCGTDNDRFICIPQL